MHSTLAPAPDRSDLRPLTSVLGPLLLAAALAWLWFSLCRQLSYEWSANEQYSYGWFVPFLAAFLFWLRFEDWEQGAEVGRREGAEQGAGSAELGRKKSVFLIGKPGLAFGYVTATLAFLLLAALLPIRLFEVANPDWRPLSWLHALTALQSLLAHKGQEASAADWLLEAQLSAERGAPNESRSSLEKVFNDVKASSQEQLQAAVLELRVSRSGSAQDQKNRADAWARIATVAKGKDACLTPASNSECVRERADRALAQKFFRLPVPCSSWTCLFAKADESCHSWNKSLFCS